MAYALRHKVFPINALPACQFVEAGIDDILWNPDIKFEAVRGYYHRIDADVLFLFSDIVIQAEAMGADVSYSHDAMPSIRKPARHIHLPSPARVPRMTGNAEVLRRMAREFPGRHKAALVYGPFTVAGQVAGEQAILRAVIECPGDVLDLVEKALGLAREYADLLLSSGADVLWVADPLASLLPPDSFRRFAGEPLSRLFRIHSSGPTVLHICGDTSHMIRDMIETGATGISFDQCMDLPVHEDEIPGSIGIIGNLDPVEVVELSSADEVAASVNDLAAMMGILDNFTLSTGCALPPATPIENIARFVEEGRAVLSGLAPHSRLLTPIADAVHRGERTEIPRFLYNALNHGVEPSLAFHSALVRAVRKASARYDAKRCFLPEVLLVVDAFYEGFKILEPLLGLKKDRPPDVILGTVKGDLHEIGKDLVKIILETNGIQVLDLGVDVPEEQFLKAARSVKAPILGLSVFISSARKQLARTVACFRSEGMSSVKILVGGAAASPQIASQLGVYGYARDAVRAAGLVKEILKSTEDGNGR